VGRQLKFHFVSTAFVLSFLLAAGSFAQGPPQGGAHGHGHNHNQKYKGTPGVRERWSTLPPDERQVFTKNAQRWLRMSPQEQQVLREREKVYRKQLQQEADKAVRQSGLQLDREARDRFETRYWLERRRMERDLRKEIEVRLQQQLPALSERLKSEFQSRPAPNGRSTSTPTGPQR
jgi:hypothetical protein